MANFETGYQPLQSCQENGEDTPQDNEVLFHVVPEGSKARWNHIEDLDSFFTRVYKYHQKHGFQCMMLQEFLELVQFVFVVLFSTFLLECVDYTVLFNDGPSRSNPLNATVRKVTLSQAVIPLETCIANFNGTIVICLLVALIFWLLRVVKVVYHLFQFMDIKAFYSTALKINECDVDNMTWHEVQHRMQEVQTEQQMCIHKQELTELDIYHRILRFKNYTVAMINKSLLPIKFRVPFLGEVVYLTKGLMYNFEMILFWGPWAPFENSWHLKDDYKRASKRKELAELLSRRILWLGIANFLLCPLILIWQILYFFFNYAEVIKREPGSLGARRWSIYGRMYVRHFNELDHELNARLNRAYRFALKYMGIFTSHTLTILARNVAFFTGSILAVLIILTVVDEDVLQVEHVLTCITMLGMIVAVCRVFIPDEHLVWCPEKLMMSILSHIHYMPESWKGNAHTTRVRAEFAQLFQYKAVYLLEELLSPVITPIILCFYLRKRTLDIVDFFRNFTVEVVGVGDICSFAQMDIRKHGNPQWMTDGHTEADECQQAEDGKTELSLMHFTLTNPEWKPPMPATAFISNLQNHAHKDAEALHQLQDESPLYYSLHSMSSLGGGYSSVVASILHPITLHSSTAPGLSSMSHMTMKGGLNRTEGPLQVSNTGLLASVHHGTSGRASPPLTSLSKESIQTDTNEGFHGHVEFAAANMSFSALYMHELHHQRHRRHCFQSVHAQSMWRHPMSDMPNIQEVREEQDQEETIPLLDIRLAKSS